MSETAIDTNLLDLGDGRNPFDELASRLERLNLEGSPASEIERLEKILLFLERKFQDFQDINNDKSKLIYQAISANIMLIDAHEFYSIDILSNNLESIKELSLKLSDPKNNIDTKDYLLSNIISHLDTKPGNLNSRELFNIYNDTFKKVVLKEEVKEEWILELNFATSKEDNHKPLEFLHTLIEGLNTIEGVKVTLEEIKIGSIQARVKAIFDDVTSKEEVKEVLKSAQKFAKGKLEKEFSEFEKNNSETLKNTIEAEILQENLQSIKSDESKEVKKLESESLRYDIEKKKIELERSKLQFFKEKKDLLKELLADGFIDQKNFEMLIKGISFIKIVDGQIMVNENIDIIDKL